MGGPGDRNFDAGPARDLYLDPLFLFEPPLFGCQKTSKCEHSKNHMNHEGDRPAMHVVQYILFQEFASHLKQSAHRKNANVLGIVGSLIFQCFLPSAARSLKRTKKHRWIDIRFLGTPWPILRLRGVTKQKVLPCVVCLCGAVGVTGVSFWRG